MAGSLSSIKLEDAVKKKLESGELNIVVLGSFGVGKSALINALFYQKGKKYKQVAKESVGKKRCTDDVIPHVLQDDDIGVKITIYDSPGLKDDKNLDRRYLLRVNEVCPNVHLVIYCTKLTEPIRPDEKKLIADITSAFDTAVWKRTVIALTCANQFQPSDPDANVVQCFNTELREKKKVLNECLKDVCEEKNWVDSCTFPVGSARPELPTGEDWKVGFWRGCFDACDKEGEGALLRWAWQYKPFVTLMTGAAGTGIVGLGVGGAAVAGVIDAIPAGVTTGVVARASVVYFMWQKYEDSKKIPAADTDEEEKEKRD